MVERTLDQLDTPSAVIDDARMARNIGRMQARMAALGVRFRPHVKTTKCVAIARLQRQAGAQGITVSTLKEAEQFFADGFDDILYAVALAPHKVKQAWALIQRGCRLQLVVDSTDAARALIAVKRERSDAEDHAGVLIEVDVDGHRSGVAPDSPLLLELGRLLHDGGLLLLGVMAHAGSSYELTSHDELVRLAELERARAVHAAQRLRDANLPCPVVSVGSTPTALSATRLDGVTEVRAGVYVFFDLVMAGIGVCGADEIALSVLTTVIGHHPGQGRAIVDAGWMAMSRDRGTDRQPVDQAYGAVCDVNGTLIDGLLLSGANQEHGIVTYRDSTWATDIASRLPIGTRLRILPNHACATGAQHTSYHVVHGTQVVAEWPRFNGW